MSTISPIKFSKMHGLGNDFVVVEAISQSINPSKELIKQLADRHTGIGFDQLLLIEKSASSSFLCRIYNPDGSEAEQCGNGLRCVAKFLHDKQFITDRFFSIETKAGSFDVSLKESQLVEVSMGVPCFTPEKIPFKTQKIQNTYFLSLEDEEKPLEVAVLSMGNPHVILIVNSLNEFPVKEIGTRIAKHPAFPNSTNVGFMQIINKKNILLRTVERGAGETFACGSNACAAVVAGIKNALLDRQVTVSLPYGELHIEWESDNSPVKLRGPAIKIFDGLINL